MFGKPKDVPGECNAHCYVGDDYGDNTATFRCSRPARHDGRHRDEFRHGTAVLEWERDERCYHTAPAEYLYDHWVCSKCFITERDLAREMGLPYENEEGEDTETPVPGTQFTATDFAEMLELDPPTEVTYQGPGGRTFLVVDANGERLVTLNPGDTLQVPPVSRMSVSSSGSLTPAHDERSDET